MWLIIGSLCLFAVCLGSIVSAWPVIKGEGVGFADEARLVHREAVCRNLCWNTSTVNHKYSEEILLAR
jgi:hypothetical protein